MIATVTQLDQAQLDQAQLDQAQLDQAQLDQAQLDQALVALADPTRRAIVQRLAAGEARVTALAEPFAISLNSVSKHIRVLERARLVRRRRAGREHVLSLDPRPLDSVADWIAAQRAAWASRLEALDALLQEEDRARRQRNKGRPRNKGRRR